MKEFFKKHTLATFIIVVVLAIVGLILYVKRKRYFTDNFFDKGSVGFVTEKPHGLKELDTIKITQDSGAKNSIYDGLADVTKVIDNYKFVINKGWAGSSPVNPGYFVKQNLF